MGLISVLAGAFLGARLQLNVCGDKPQTLDFLLVQIPKESSATTLINEKQFCLFEINQFFEILPLVKMQHIFGMLCRKLKVDLYRKEHSLECCKGNSFL